MQDISFSLWLCFSSKQIKLKTKQKTKTSTGEHSGHSHWVSIKLGAVTVNCESFLCKRKSTARVSGLLYFEPHELAFTALFAPSSPGDGKPTQNALQSPHMGPGPLRQDLGAKVASQTALTANVSDSQLKCSRCPCFYPGKKQMLQDKKKKSQKTSIGKRM